MTETVVAADTGWYRYRCPNLKQIAGTLDGATVDHLAAVGAVDPLYHERRTKGLLELFRDLRTTAGSVTAAPRPAGHPEMLTIGCSGTGADPLRTFLTSSRALEDSGPRC